ncbi:MAG: DoxX family protein, partial [Limisphaerales bacterium]
MPSSRSLWHWLLAIFFLVAGANHFINPKPYLAMMPSYLPCPAELVWISGVAEMLGGLGVLFPQTRVVAGWGLIALLVAVFPANLHVAIHGWPEANVPQWVLWLRLPLQPILVW